MIEFLAAIVGMVLWEPAFGPDSGAQDHLAIATFVAACGIAASAMLSDPVSKIAALSTGILGGWWPSPCSGRCPRPSWRRSRGGGTGLINSLAQLGGIIAPWVVGYARDVTHSFAGLADDPACCFISLTLTLLRRHDRSLEVLEAEPARGGFTGCEWPREGRQDNVAISRAGSRAEPRMTISPRM